jgi:hypothetical protein
MRKRLSYVVTYAVLKDGLHRSFWRNAEAGDQTVLYAGLQLAWFAAQKYSALDLANGYEIPIR